MNLLMEIGWTDGMNYGKRKGNRPFLHNMIIHMHRIKRNQLSMKRILLLVVMAFSATQTMLAETCENDTVGAEGAWCWFADPRALHYENADILQTFPFSLTIPILIGGLSCMSITFFEPKMTFRNFLTFDLSLSHSSATKQAKRNLGSVTLMFCSPFWMASSNGFFDLTSVMILINRVGHANKQKLIRTSEKKE